MELKEMIEKYKTTKKKPRLTIILETFNKPATENNIEALEMLIEDDDFVSVEKFLGIKEIDKPLILEKIPHNQDDFVYQCKANYGDPADPKSLGNRILDGQTFQWYTRSYIPPDKMLAKWARLANKEMIEMDFIGNHKDPMCPTWNCGIKGMINIKRVNHTFAGGE